MCFCFQWAMAPQPKLRIEATSANLTQLMGILTAERDTRKWLFKFESSTRLLESLIKTVAFPTELDVPKVSLLIRSFIEVDEPTKRPDTMIPEIQDEKEAKQQELAKIIDYDIEKRCMWLWFAKHVLPLVSVLCFSLCVFL